jgi:hypothetical protein
VFSSRSGQWDKAQTQLVKECFVQEPMIVRLQPFTEAEQRTLFQSHLPGEDFSCFQEEAARFELIPLLGNPQFLKLFSDAYVLRQRGLEIAVAPKAHPGFPDLAIFRLVGKD